MMKAITELKEEEIQGKKVLLRVDFNVPVENGKISEIYRIKAAKETINYLINKNASVSVLSHITAVESFAALEGQIKEILGISNFELLENVRQNPGEEKNDADFAKNLAKPYDIYVNDAFSVSHRNHASLVAMTKFLPSYAGLHMMKEIDNLIKVLNMPKEGKILVLGGVKISTKFPVIKNFLDKAEHILIGGAVANVFLKARGIDIKKSLNDDNFVSEAKKFLEESDNIMIPEDYNMSDDMILDIGAKTIDEFIDIINISKMIIWNGPVGRAEDEQFSNGSKKIAEAIMNSRAFSLVGGGDTIAFLEKMKLMDKFGYVSTGGGAMLEFLAGNKLPGLVALGYEKQE